MSPSGMVDALDAALTALRRGGVLIDVRPDWRRTPRVVAHGRVLGMLAGDAEHVAIDRAADAALDLLVDARQLGRVRAGHLWHSFGFGTRADLDDYVRNGRRFVRYARGVAALVRAAAPPFTLRRSVAYGVFEKR